ncbi:MAG: M55 family metallopeptidase [Anaerolineae bacterium]
MKLYIITDLEGPAMVSRFAQTRDYQDAPELKREAVALLTGEVNAAVDGILDAAPEAEIVVWDGHGNGGIDVMAFHPKAKLIARGPIKPPYFLDSSFDALLFVGQHAMADTRNAPLCHTYSSRTIEYYKLNGQFVGEFGARAIMAGTFGVPTIFISGDDKAVEEARALVPNIYGAVVKEGLGWELALHLSHETACDLIRETVAEAVRHIDEIPPVRVEPPYEQEIRVRDDVSIGGYLEAGAERVDDRTVIFRSGDICDLRI